MCLPTPVPLQATAGAMASKDVAGIGGAAFFNDGSAVWFQFEIHLEEAQTVWPWIGDDMQKHIEITCPICIVLLYRSVPAQDTGACGLPSGNRQQCS